MIHHHVFSRVFILNVMKTNEYPLVHFATMHCLPAFQCFHAEPLWGITECLILPVWPSPLSGTFSLLLPKSLGQSSASGMSRMTGYPPSQGISHSHVHRSHLRTLFKCANFCSPYCSPQPAVRGLLWILGSVFVVGTQDNSGAHSL